MYPIIPNITNNMNGVDDVVTEQVLLLLLLLTSFIAPIIPYHTIHTSSVAFTVSIRNSHAAETSRLGFVVRRGVAVSTAMRGLVTRLPQQQRACPHQAILPQADNIVMSKGCHGWKWRH